MKTLLQRRAPSPNRLHLHLHLQEQVLPSTPSTGSIPGSTLYSRTGHLHQPHTARQWAQPVLRECHLRCTSSIPTRCSQAEHCCRCACCMSSSKGLLEVASQVEAKISSPVIEHWYFTLCYIIQTHCTKKDRLPTERSGGPSPGGLGRFLQLSRAS